MCFAKGNKSGFIHRHRQQGIGALVAAPDAMDDATVKKAGFIDLGSIKGNMGDQNYDVPNTVDLDKYQAVTIWCAHFNVNFGTAP
jgi:hypothetical protein